MSMWLDQPVMLHSSREESCMLTPEQCAYRGGHWRDWYQADHVYSLGTIYFFVSVLGVCILGYWASRLAPKSLQERRSWQRLLSSVRFLTYRRYDVKALHWYTPSLGVCALLVAGAVFFLAMTLGPKPYYWPNTPTVNYGSSPPLASRAGYMALACLPFMIVLPTKANIIASLTGVSHERLIVFHNWVGWAMFVLALVHTFPFIVYNLPLGDMTELLMTNIVWWTGIVALILQAYLQFGSLPWIRNRFYEFFKATHLTAALLFVVIFFLHCNFRLSSWDYFIAAGVLYTLCWLYASVRMYFQFGPKHARLEMVSNRALKITIPVETPWHPTQHVFLRFLTLGAHAFTAHPFTICSIPPSSLSIARSQLVFYMHPQGGLTSRLTKLATQRPGLSVPVMLDGPYGGIESKKITSYDRSLVIACGSGASLSLPIVMNALLRLRWRRENQAEKADHQMHVIIATRDAQLLEWYEDALIGFMEENKLSMDLDGIRISVHLTGSESRASSSSVDPEKQSDTDRKSMTGNAASAVNDTRLPITVCKGRPDISAIVREATLQNGISLAIVSCGPAGVMKEVEKEAAAAQLRIMSSKVGAREVYLHSETFSW